MNNKYTIEIEVARELTDEEIYRASFLLAGEIPISTIRIKPDRIDDLKQRRTSERINQMQYFLNKLINEFNHLKKGLDNDL